MSLLYIDPTPDVVASLEILYKSKNLYQINNYKHKLIEEYFTTLEPEYFTTIWYLFFEFLWNDKYYVDFWRVLKYYIQKDKYGLTTMLINIKDTFILGDKSQSKPLKSTKIPIVKPGDIMHVYGDYHIVMISSYPHIQDNNWVVQYVNCMYERCDTNYFKLDETKYAIPTRLIRWVATDDNIIPTRVVTKALEWLNRGLYFACTTKMIKAAFTRCFGEIDEEYLHKLNEGKIKIFCSEFVLAVWQATIQSEFPEYLPGFKLRPYGCTPDNVDELPKYVPYFKTFTTFYP